MGKVIFDEEGVFIEDKSKTYYMVEQVDGKGGIVPVKNRAFRETMLMYRLREAIKGKKVRIIVEEV